MACSQCHERGLELERANERIQDLEEDVARLETSAEEFKEALTSRIHSLMDLRDDLLPG